MVGWRVPQKYQYFIYKLVYNSGRNLKKLLKGKILEEKETKRDFSI